jgi:hypothetical protein
MGLFSCLGSAKIRMKNGKACCRLCGYKRFKFRRISPKEKSLTSLKVSLKANSTRKRRGQDQLRPKLQILPRAPSSRLQHTQFRRSFSFIWKDISNRSRRLRQLDSLTISTSHTSRRDRGHSFSRPTEELKLNTNCVVIDSK